ncbi:hypothetical protein Hdeb2414_s0082g00780861 [Helianthus debilis subsp. tardiflorus]
MFVLLVYFNSVILFIVRLMFLSGFMLKIQNSLLHSYLRSLPSWKMMAAYRTNRVADCGGIVFVYSEE